MENLTAQLFQLFFNVPDLDACGVKIHSHPVGAVADADRKHPRQRVQLPFITLAPDASADGCKPDSFSSIDGGCFW